MHDAKMSPCRLKLLGNFRGDRSRFNDRSDCKSGKSGTAAGVQGCSGLKVRRYDYLEVFAEFLNSRQDDKAT